MGLTSVLTVVDVLKQSVQKGTLLMELLADEEANSEKIPDDGELEGSGDDYDGWHN